MKALSIMQPWAWLIVNGHKDIENRSWATKYRGPVLIHAGKRMDAHALAAMRLGSHPAGRGTLPTMTLPSGRDLPLGGIVGIAEITDCVTKSASSWFVGEFGFVLANALPLPFMPLRGQLGFFGVPPSLQSLGADLI